MRKYQSEKVELEVIWDGSRTGANGGYLGCEPETPQPLPAAGAHLKQRFTLQQSVALEKTIKRSEE